LAHPNINVNLKNRDGRTPLSFACQLGRVSVVEMLLKDPRVNITLDDTNGCTPLWYASCYGNREIIEWLIASGKDMGDVENKIGRHWYGRERTTQEIAREETHTSCVTAGKIHRQSCINPS